VNGSGISTRGFKTGKLAYFSAAQIAPRRWSGTYSLLRYLQPAIPERPSRLQGCRSAPRRSSGAIAARFCASIRRAASASPIAVSVGWGVVKDDLFARGQPDQLGLGFAWNKTNIAAVGQPARTAEFVAESYARYAVLAALRIGPDIQLYNHPALAAGFGPAAVFSLHSTASF
jgi:carbohydrate-selective porin OprB